MIELHKSLVETTADANAALAEATRQANAAVSQLQHDFSLAKQAFQKQLMQDLETSTARTQTFLERLIESMDSSVQSAISKVMSAMKDIESTTAEASDNIRNVKNDSIDLQKHIGKVFQQVVEGGAELAATQTHQWDRSRELATDLAGSLRDIRDSEISALLGLFHAIHDQLVCPVFCGWRYGG